MKLTTGPRSPSQLPSNRRSLLLHLHHYHRILHGQHLRRFRYRHIPERGRVRLQELRARQKSGKKSGLVDSEQDS